MRSGSPGWWMQRLFNKLSDRQRRQRLDRLHRYRIGLADMPAPAAAAAQQAFAAFQRKARSNFAELIVSAVSERMRVVGFRTAADRDETGDEAVADLWRRAQMRVVTSVNQDQMLSLAESYVVVGPVDDETGAPIVTAEDPRWMIAARDPAVPWRLRAALKVLHDDAEEEVRAYLYLPGSATTSGPAAGRAQILVAVRKMTGGDLWIPANVQGPAIGFDSTAWSWDERRSVVLDHARIPVVGFFNKDGLGEYEAHIDLIDRINHQILDRMVIASMQAFRQRAVRGLPLVDEQGKPIDYRKVFVMDPAALWQLPENASMWESAVVDLTPILSAVKNDVEHLAAVTRTPMHMLSPSGVNQSAEGASLVREGLVFKVEDRMDRCTSPYAQVASLMLLQSGDARRADLAQLEPIWAPAERLSLAERADAASKAGQDIPLRSRLIQIWGFDPSTADRMMTEWADDELLSGVVAAAAAEASAVNTGTAPAAAGEVAGDQPAVTTPPPTAAAAAPGVRTAPSRVAA